MMTKEHALKYDDKEVLDFKRVPNVGYYNHNYYYGYDNDILYAESDDYELTEWYLCEDWFLYDSLDKVPKIYIGFSITKEIETITVDV